MGGGWTLSSWAPSLVGETARTTPTLLHGRVGSRLKWGFKSMQTEPRGSEFQWGMSFFFNFSFCIGVQPINNVVIVSGEQQRDSAEHNHVSILPQPPLPSRQKARK